MTNRKPNRGRAAVALALALIFQLAGLAAAQDADTLKKWEEFDFSKRAVTPEQLEPLSLDQLKVLRGIVFGRHGRVFKDFEIKNYLAERPWYKPDANFQNSVA